MSGGVQPGHRRSVGLDWPWTNALRMQIEQQRKNDDDDDSKWRDVGRRKGGGEICGWFGKRLWSLENGDKKKKASLFANGQTVSSKQTNLCCKCVNNLENDVDLEKETF